MRGFQCLFLIALAGAKRFEPGSRFDAPNPAQAKRVDVFPESFQRPVPFGHIYKEGFEDPHSGLKSPVDLLEMDMVQPKSPEQAREMLQQASPDKIEFFRKPLQPKGYINPRDKILSELGVDHSAPFVNETQFRWYDLVDLQARNLVNPPSPRPPGMENYDRARSGIDPPPPKAVGLPKFMTNRFAPSSTIDLMTITNYTTCDQFGSKAFFYPKDIINLDWVPFYIWSVEMYSVAIVHRFHYATKKMVNMYRKVYKKHDSIDWDQPKLHLKGMNEFLLVAADRKGLFHALSLIEMPPAAKDIALPYSTIRLKIEDPYLVLMFCGDLFATVMAMSGNEPPTDKEKIAEAATIGINAPGRPVSRDLLEEQKNIRAEKEKELQLKERETIKINEPLPPVNEPFIK